MLLNGPSHEEEQEREEEKGESKIQGLFIIGSKKMCWLFLFNDTLQTLPYAAPPIGKIQPRSDIAIICFEILNVLDPCSTT